MLATILQILFKLSVIFGRGVMVVCTVFVIACVIKGDISINMIRSKEEKEVE